MVNIGIQETNIDLMVAFGKRNRLVYFVNLVKELMKDYPNDMLDILGVLPSEKYDEIIALLDIEYTEANKAYEDSKKDKE